MDRAILLFIFAIIALSAPVSAWWSNYSHHWYLPYLIWALILILKIKLLRWRNRQDA